MYDIVDTHTHAISPDHVRYPLAPVGGRQSDWSAHRPADYETLLAAMDVAGIAHAMVVQASTAYGNDNRYVVDAVKAHPDRFCGVFSIDVLVEDAVDKFKYWIAEGMRGLRLFLTGTTMPGQASWLDDERSYPVWEYAQANNISICLQMTAAGIPALTRMLGLFPAARVLLDHLARPDLAGGPPYASAASLFDLAAHPGVYLKLTNRTISEAARGVSTPQAFFPRVVEAFGAKRIAWGSNFPSAAGSLESLLAEAKAGLSMLSAEDQAWIFGDTARSIYPALNKMGAAS
ncbi:Predicted metal-dependent hydrolase, TIM-barrel fold [Collimonas sp. OK607]|uniref:amidohydrolase family protein n=1 Tax=Collimonas sp. OK607 TaxID=1798194 RepID=UPI0008E80199|nr:amidohydrolase family protein [Collimonas sp. OK607]SFB28695.1 Predicted metal-dependent hydrolase, TIM-barrel fold [Collimonas sp. OK607]